jgi:hypothetical protein
MDHNATPQCKHRKKWIEPNILDPVIRDDTSYYTCWTITQKENKNQKTSFRQFGRFAVEYAQSTLAALAIPKIKSIFALGLASGLRPWSILLDHFF